MLFTYVPFSIIDFFVHLLKKTMSTRILRSSSKGGQSTKSNTPKTKNPNSSEDTNQNSVNQTNIETVEEVVDKNEDSKSSTSGESKKTELTAAEKARCERNRQKALLLRQARLSNQQIQGENKRTVGCSRVVDTGGGFFIEEESDAKPQKVKRVDEPAPVIAGDMSFCLECDQPFLDSYLLTTYDYSVCDKCRDPEDKHTVITKTQAREMYLLSEADLNVREPILKFVVRKNPRNSRWGDMKLYLKLQIEERALEIWGTPEALEKEHKAREVKKEVAKKKKFNKKMKQLRQEVRSSLYQVKTTGHEHVYGDETPCEGEEDMWKKSCTSCGHEVVFEKM